MERERNCGVTCGVTECKFNCDGMACSLDKIHVGNDCTCDSGKCTCCDSFRHRD